VKGRTIICVTHRLSTIKNADNIIVMSGGEIVDQGTHGQLITRCSMYAGFIKAQQISPYNNEGQDIRTALQGTQITHQVFPELPYTPSENSRSLRLNVTTKMTDQYIGSTNFNEKSDEAVPEKQYSNFQLLKKVYVFENDVNNRR
jgi:ABC-type multidrug transport system ATPase subunit